ncbi:hypothetical protein BDE02_13G096300 [Populus trichocarpa]|nr:hypothetical protein BDE02_13G096300 [Populus trichocarpa]
MECISTIQEISRQSKFVESMAAYKNQKKAAIRLAFVNLLCFEVSVMRKELNEIAGINFDCLYGTGVLYIPWLSFSVSSFSLYHPAVIGSF